MHPDDLIPITFVYDTCKREMNLKINHLTNITGNLKMFITVEFAISHFILILKTFKVYLHTLNVEEHTSISLRILIVSFQITHPFRKY